MAMAYSMMALLERSQVFRPTSGIARTEGRHPTERRAGSDYATGSIFQAKCMPVFARKMRQNKELV
jgi:hypothetical protein